VHESSKATSLPIARAIVETYVAQPHKLPWYVDLLNLNLNVSDLNVARARIAPYAASFAADGTRVTENLDFA
jgi:malate synthase